MINVIVLLIIYFALSSALSLVVWTKNGQLKVPSSVFKRVGYILFSPIIFICGCALFLTIGLIGVFVVALTGNKKILDWLESKIA